MAKCGLERCKVEGENEVLSRGALAAKLSGLFSGASALLEVDEPWRMEVWQACLVELKTTTTKEPRNLSSRLTRSILILEEGH